MGHLPYNVFRSSSHGSGYRRTGITHWPLRQRCRVVVDRFEGGIYSFVVQLALPLLDGLTFLPIAGNFGLGMFPFAFNVVSRLIEE